MQPGFWLSTMLSIGGAGVSIAGLVFSVKAFREARRAKRAATEAGRTVKLQTIAIELTEISQRLDKLKMELMFNEARDLLSEISRRLRRVVSPFAEDESFKAAITALREALKAAQDALRSVQPTDPSQEAAVPHAVYYATQEPFALINNCVADLLGLFEKQTMDLGEHDVQQ